MEWGSGPGVEAAGWVDARELAIYGDGYARGLEDGRRIWRRVALALAGVLGLIAVAVFVEWAA